MPVCACVYSRDQCWMPVTIASHFIFQRDRASRLEFAILDRLTGQVSQGPSCLCLHRAGITDIHGYAELSKCYRSEPKSSFLCGKHFPHQTIAPWPKTPLHFLVNNFLKPIQNHQLRDKISERHKVQEKNQSLLSIQITTTEGYWCHSRKCYFSRAI